MTRTAIPILFIATVSHCAVSAQPKGDVRMPPFQTYLTHVSATCVTFVRPEAPETYLGYRIVEQEPEQAERPLTAHASHPEAEPADPPPWVVTEPPAIPAGPYTDDWLTTFPSKQKQSKGTHRFSTDRSGVAWFEHLEAEGIVRQLVMRAVPDGIEMWMRLSSESAIPGAYVVQQCFRLSGETNQEWRHHVALVPQFSEYDLWARRQPPRSLTYVRRDNAWMQIPAIEQGVRCDTPAGVEMATLQGSQPKDEIPHGLIVRESADGSSVVGMFWERTTRVTNHHPADCLHSFVDLGPIEAGTSRSTRGKVYWLEGTKDYLLEHWRRDFPVNQRR